MRATAYTARGSFQNAFPGVLNLSEKLQNIYIYIFLTKSGKKTRTSEFPLWGHLRLPEGGWGLVRDLGVPGLCRTMSAYAVLRPPKAA